ncbi:MAG: NADH-quinone oxidoreductase subunit J [Bacteroidia bacterium]|nr:NADH-quinone oxidoreductase subunit J [Bacteroidia bacterium]
MTLTVFYLLSALSVFSGLMVVLSRKAVHSVLYLVFCFFTIAGHYLMLNAQFLAAVHVIVYAGAIMVLFLFVIMMLNLNLAAEAQKTPWIKISAVILSGLMLLVLVASVKGAEELSAAQPQNDIGLVKNIGNILFDKYLLPFELISLLLLSAMVGAVLMGRKEPQPQNE